MHTDDRNTEDVIFRRIRSKEFIAAFVFFMILLFAAGWILFVWNERRITTLDESGISTADPTAYLGEVEGVKWERDDVSATDDYVLIKGWLLKPGVSVQKVAMHVVLRDQKDGRYYVVPTDVTERTDITERMGDGNIYDYSGFTVILPYWEKLDGKTDYDIYLKYELNEEEPVLVPLHTTLKTNGMGTEG